MGDSAMANLKLAALCFLLGGLAGLIISSMISVSYQQTLPKMPDPLTMHMIPRQIHGITIYQTVEEDRRLDMVEYSSTATFLIGFALSLVYFRKWGIARAIEGENDELGCDIERESSVSKLATASCPGGEAKFLDTLQAPPLDVRRLLNLKRM